MLITKILEGTLNAGSTSISFTDSDIPNSFIRIGSTDPDLMPVSESLSGNVLTITYEAQSSNKGIVVNLVKAGISVIDALNSTDANNALSAKQGKVLKEIIDNLGVPSLSELSDVNFTSLSDGDIIVYDGISEKFVNNSMPSIPSSITDLDDVEITNIQNDQVLVWDSVAEKFVNSDQSGGGGSGSLKYPMDNDEHEIESGVYVKRFVGTNAGTNLVLMSNLTGNLLDCYGYVRSSLSGYTNQYYTFCSFVNNDWRAFIYQNGSNITMSNGNFLLGEYMVWCVYTK